MLEIAVMVEGQMGLNWPRWKAIAKAVEEIGFAGLYRSDHFTNPSPPDEDSLELWTSLTWLASHTSRIKFGPLVSPFSFRHPSMVARVAASVDELSDGRLQLGLGAGWQEREHKSFGFELGTLDDRFQRFEEGLEIVTRLFGSSQAVSYQGNFYQINDAILLPNSREGQGPKILIGGNGMRRSIPLAIQYAQEWNGVYLSLEDFSKRIQLIDQLLESAGREKESFQRSLMMGCVYGSNLKNYDESANELRQSGVAAGSTAEIIDFLHQYEEAGCQRVMLQWLELDNLDDLAEMGSALVKEFRS